MNEELKNNAITLANLAELVSMTIRQIAGNEISTSINGTTASSEILTTYVLNRVHSKIIV